MRYNKNNVTIGKPAAKQYIKKQYIKLLIFEI